MRSVAVGPWLLFRHLQSTPLSVYILANQLYLFCSLFIVVTGKDFDLPAHKRLLKDSLVDERLARTADICLPVCKGPLEIIENTWTGVTKLDDLAIRRAVYVLDDGPDDDVRRMAERLNFHYLCRPDRPELVKAGNLRYAFVHISADFFVVFNADMCPRPEFLLKTMSNHVANDRIAILQTPQPFRYTKDQTWTNHGAKAVQKYIYRVCSDVKMNGEVLHA